MIVCPKCGQENADGTMNCAGCRINLEWALENPEYFRGEATGPNTAAMPAEIPEEGLGVTRGLGCALWIWAVFLGGLLSCPLYEEHTPLCVILIFPIALGSAVFVTVWVYFLVRSPGIGRLARALAIAFGLMLFIGAVGRVSDALRGIVSGMFDLPSDYSIAIGFLGLIVLLIENIARRSRARGE